MPRGRNRPCRNAPVWEFGLSSGRIGRAKGKAAGSMKWSGQADAKAIVQDDLRLFAQEWRVAAPVVRVSKKSVEHPFQRLPEAFAPEGGVFFAANVPRKFCQIIVGNSRIQMVFGMKVNVDRQDHFHKKFASENSSAFQGNVVQLRYWAMLNATDHPDIGQI